MKATVSDNFVNIRCYYCNNFIAALGKMTERIRGICPHCHSEFAINPLTIDEALLYPEKHEHESSFLRRIIESIAGSVICLFYGIVAFWGMRCGMLEVVVTGTIHPIWMSIFCATIIGSVFMVIAIPIMTFTSKPNTEVFIITEKKEK